MRGRSFLNTRATLMRVKDEWTRVGGCWRSELVWRWRDSRVLGFVTRSYGVVNVDDKRGSLSLLFPPVIWLEPGVCIWFRN